MDAFDTIESDPRHRISRLEAEIEALTHSLDRGQKIELIAKLILIGGALWIVGGLLGFLRFDAAGILGSIAAVIGGIVLFGSNGSTLKQTQARIEAAEAERAALIGSIGLRVVGGGGGANGGGYLN